MAAWHLFSTTYETFTVKHVALTVKHMADTIVGLALSVDIKGFTTKHNTKLSLLYGNGLMVYGYGLNHMAWSWLAPHVLDHKTLVS